jgi:hypothetical protein
MEVVLEVAFAGGKGNVKERVWERVWVSSMTIL